MKVPDDLGETLRRFECEVNKRPARRPFGPILACSICHDPDFGVRHVGDTCAACAITSGDEDPRLIALAEDVIQAIGADHVATLLSDHLDRNATARELLMP